MLVKELRQGMRTRVFVTIFILFQALMFFIILVAANSIENSNAGASISNSLFGIFSVIALIIQPLRGMNALSSEIKNNTLELTALTRLNASRIIFGKWTAIASQTALILVTIIPYLIFRYFFGGMQLASELKTLGMIFITSLAFTAFSVGFSNRKTLFSRISQPLVVIFIFLVFSTPLSRGGSFSSSSWSFGSGNSYIPIISYICLAAYLGWCSLSYGIASIAPIAENHSTLRRLIALALAIAAVFLGMLDSVPMEALFFIFAFITAPAIITALTENPTLLPPVCKPFVKRGFLGKMLGLFLLPGWPTGTFYTAILAFITLLGINIAEESNPNSLRWEMIAFSLTCFSTVTLAALLTAPFIKKEISRLPFLMIAVLTQVILAMLASIIAYTSSEEGILWLFAWNPSVWTSMMSYQSEFKEDNIMALAIGFSALYLFLLVVLGLKAYFRYRGVMEDTRKQIEDTDSSVLP